MLLNFMKKNVLEIQLFSTYIETFSQQTHPVIENNRQRNGIKSSAHVFNRILRISSEPVAAQIC